MASIIQRPLEHGDTWPSGHPHEGEPTPENKPTMVIIHAMAYQIDYQGERLYAASFLDLMGLSAHILVAPGGDRIRCREDNQIAWHAKGYNVDTLGIEVLVPGVYGYQSFTQRIAEPWADNEQLQATADQLREWGSLWSIQQIRGHNHVDPERKVDPGRGFQWGRLMALLAKP